MQDLTPVGYVALVSVPEERRTDALEPNSTWQAASAVHSDRSAIEGRVADLRRRKQPNPPAVYAVGGVYLLDEDGAPW